MANPDLEPEKIMENMMRQRFPMGSLPYHESVSETDRVLFHEDEDQIVGIRIEAEAAAGEASVGSDGRQNLLQAVFYRCVGTHHHGRGGEVELEVGVVGDI